MLGEMEQSTMDMKKNEQGKDSKYRNNKNKNNEHNGAKENGLVKCPSCGYEFDGTLAACPACGTMHYPGAEADYLEHLDDVKEQLQSLDKVHGEVAGREAKRQGKRILIIAAVILALAAVFGGILYYWEHQYDRDSKADYLWQQENFPQWDQWYENGEYDQLLNAYLTALDENRGAWSYAHYDFCNIYMCISEVEETLQELSEDNVVDEEVLEDATQGRELLSSDYSWMLYDELTVVLCESRDGISEEDLEKLEPWREKYEEDLLSRWNITSRQYVDFQEDDSVLAGWVSYDKCEKFVDAWMQKNAGK